MLATTEFSPAAFRQRREALGLSRFKLAVRMGMTEGSILAYERGIVTPSVRALACAADALGIDPGQFFARRDRDAA